MAPARQQPPPPFSKDEKVLCFHMDMLYEAKIMDVQPAEKPNEGYRYKVHYKGWKNTWDDWVLVDRIRPFDDEHKELAAQLHAQLKTSMQKTAKVPKKVVKSGGESARGSEERSSAVTQGGRGGRRGKDWDLEQVRTEFAFERLEVSLSCFLSLSEACLPFCDECVLFLPFFLVLFPQWRSLLRVSCLAASPIMLSTFCLLSQSSSLSGQYEDCTMLFSMRNALKRVYLAFFWPESGVSGLTTQGQSEGYNCPCGLLYRVTSDNLGL